ncbi:9189_t:CDS:2, partial [Scutellospora calospora]
QSGIILLPEYEGGWLNCTTDIAAIANRNFSIEVVDFSVPVTPGFGIYVTGDPSLDRIHGNGFSIDSFVTSSALPNTTTDLNNIKLYNETYYCGTLESFTSQCDSQYMGLPSSNQENMKWCLSLTNPFNNSQKIYVSFDGINYNNYSTNIGTNSNNATNI